MEISEKFPLGPIVSPRPGPTFDIAVAAAEIEVIKSNPSIESNAVTIKKIIKYKYINEIIEDINFSSIFCFSYFILNIPCG